MKELYTLVGMRHRGTERIVRELRKGEALILRREPANRYDRNAVQIISLIGTTEIILGYVKGTEAVKLAPQMDAAGTPEIIGKFVIGQWPQVEIES